MTSSNHHTSTRRAPPLGPQRAGTVARWPGRPDERPRTNAEDALRQRRHRQLTRILALLLAWALGTYLWAPQRVLRPLLDAPPPLRPLAVSGTQVLVSVYPWVQLAVLLLLGLLLVHLGVALLLFVVQRRNRAAVRWRTLELDIPQTLAPTSLLASADLFLGLQHLDSPLGRGRGLVTALVFVLLGGDDGRMRLRARANRGNARLEPLFAPADRGLRAWHHRPAGRR